MKEEKFNISYDQDNDVLYLSNKQLDVEESVELTEDIVIDLNKKDELVGLEIFNAYKFLNTLNEKISKDILSKMNNVNLELKRYKSYYLISISFEHNNQKYKEKLPAFTDQEYESPLIASVSS